MDVIETQNLRVLSRLKEKKPISSDYIVYNMGIPRASARIYNLKKRGYKINGFWVSIQGKSKYQYKLEE